MRLSTEQVRIIRLAAQKSFGPKARVWLFGSRVDERKHGGDIDLLIRTESGPADVLLEQKIRFLRLLEDTIGERRIDAVIETPGDSRPIVHVAHETGVAL